MIGRASVMSALILIATNISIFGRETRRPSNGPDENRSNLLVINQRQLRMEVDVINCRWSAHLKGTKVSINNAYFLPGNDPSGWEVISSINNDDKNDLGNYVTVTLRGKKPGELDFNYQLSVSKSGNDIIISLGRSNNTGHSVDVTDMDYFVSDNVSLEGTNDQWITFGAHSIYHDYYDLIPVNTLKEPGMYESSHLVRNQKTGNVVLMGHLTANKGHSRFEVQNQGKPDMMRVRAYCKYKVMMPNSRSFVGEKLLFQMSDDGIRSLEHLGDLIDIASDVRLKERYPLDFEDKALIRGTHNTWTSWASGNSTDTKNPRGNPVKAEEFIRNNGLDKFYYGVGRGGGDPDFGNGIQWALYYCGGNGEYGGVDFPAECYLPVKVKWGNGKVVDFSNPVAIKFERDRVLGLIKGKEDKVFRGWVDWSETWDVWPGQYDPFMSALETWHAGSAPYRELPAEKIAPRMRSKSCMTRYDFNYGSMQLCRVDEDADGWPSGDAYGDNVQLNKNGSRAFLSECVPGATSRFYYNTRVFWNDPDGHHVYSFFGHQIDFARAKVMTCFKVMATSCLNPAESFDIPYPDDRIELLKRAAPPTTDPAYPVDLFLRKPASIWNMPVERSFGSWDILCVINYKEGSPDFIATMDAKKDLRLDPQKEYLVYEFFSKKVIGTFKGAFTSRAIKGPDCDVYSIVEKQNRPVLLSTSRHIRHMAFDIKNMVYDQKSKALIGLSRAVSGDPYQLSIYVPEGYRLDRVEVPAGLKVETKMDDRLLMINFTTDNEDDVEWKVYFKQHAA
jgi:hypothetical protein